MTGPCTDCLSRYTVYVAVVGGNSHLDRSNRCRSVGSFVDSGHFQNFSFPVSTNTNQNF